MKSISLATALSVSALFFSAPVHAGETNLNKDGQTISLYCNNSGCFVQNGAEGWTNVSQNRRKLGPGGSRNFKKWERAYKKEGWKGA